VSDALEGKETAVREAAAVNESLERTKVGEVVVGVVVSFEGVIDVGI
jgi:hypothetical protein